MLTLDYPIQRVQEVFFVDSETPVIIRKETDAGIVVTEDGGNVQERLDNIIVYYNTESEFPNLGNRATLYIVENSGEESIYIWDSVNLRYRNISNNYQNIKVIDGGTAKV